MTSEETHPKCPGRLFIVLWAFTVLIELFSLQIRLAIFGGTGWLTNVKFTTLGSQLGFTGALAILCAAVCGLWVLLFTAGGRLCKSSPEKVARRCATAWIIILAIDLIFRHKVGELLGDAFDFFEFANGVGGVWRMLVQAFQWYGDVILLCILGITAVAAATWAFFRWFFKPRKTCSPLDRIPKPAFICFILASLVTGFLIMSILAPSFPATQKVLATETMFGAAFNAIVNAGTDFDNDGYGAFDLPPDSMPFDGNIHPHALDIPDDGIDQDQILGDFTTETLPRDFKNRIDSQGLPIDQSYIDRRNVIIVLMESVRHDMLDANVDGKPVMPELRQFIQKGAIRVDGAFATRGFTQNSVTQTFCGSFFDPGSSLVDDFKSLGYHTAVFNGENMLDENFDETCGWNRSGDTIVDPRFIKANVDHHESVPARMLMDEAEKFLYSKNPKMCTWDFLTHEPHINNFTDLWASYSSYNHGYNDNCANFVTAMLQTVGLISKHQIAVDSLYNYINNANGWKKVSFSDAKPGDIWISSGKGHTELAIGYTGSKLLLIGSNNFGSSSEYQGCQINTGADYGSYQRVSYAYKTNGDGYLFSMQ